MGPVPPELAYVGGILTIILGSWMTLLAILDRRTAGDDRRFDEVQGLANAAISEAEHMRLRIEEVRRERDEWRQKWERGEITIAQLRDQLEVCRTKQRALESLARERGVDLSDDR